MKLKLIMRFAGTGALACIGVLGTSATGAFAAATHLPAAELGPISMGPLPPAGPGVKVSGDCPGFLFTVTESVTFVFSSGSAVLYGPASNPNTNGGNVQGIATVTFTSATGSVDGTYVGHTHLWFGQNVNNKGQSYFGQTASLQDNGTDGTTGSLTVTASGGETRSESGHLSGWGHVNVMCS